jgi:hypothetical protein
MIMYVTGRWIKTNESSCMSSWGFIRVNLIIEQKTSAELVLSSQALLAALEAKALQTVVEENGVADRFSSVLSRKIRNSE